MKLEGNTILITGGASGIGLEMAEQLVARGNTVIITGRSKDRLDEAKKKQPKLHTIQSDVSRPEEVEAIFAQATKEFPALNVLVNCAGVMRTINLQTDKQPLDKLTQEIDINFKGPVWMVSRFLPHLSKMPNAAIVNVSSGLAFVPMAVWPVYCATKAALHSYSLSLRAQLKSSSVKVFELAPPATETPLLGDPHSPNLEGVSVMKVDAMVQACLNGMAKDTYEIRPGQSNQLKFMNRLAPEFILGQLSKPVERMLKESTQA